MKIPRDLMVTMACFSWEVFRFNGDRRDGDEGRRRDEQRAEIKLGWVFGCVMCYGSVVLFFVYYL